jgi:hypothetical protein
MPNCTGWHVLTANCTGCTTDWVSGTSPKSTDGVESVISGGSVWYQTPSAWWSCTSAGCSLSGLAKCAGTPRLTMTSGPLCPGLAVPAAIGTYAGVGLLRCQIAHSRSTLAWCSQNTGSFTETDGNDMCPPLRGTWPTKSHTSPIQTWMPSWSTHSRYLRNAALACAVRSATVPGGLPLNGTAS